MQTITIGSNSYGLVALPATPGASDMSLGMNDAIAVVASPYVPSQVQAQAWPGADGWDASLTLPPLTNAQAAEWEGFLAELRGMLNIFQIGDPRRQSPRGNVEGSAPTATGTITAMSTSITTAGWKPSTARVLLRGDLFQIGYHLHRVCEFVNSDATGLATISVWPSLREVPAVNAPLILRAPLGVWRLAENRRATQFSPGKTTTSFKLLEVR